MATRKQTNKKPTISKAKESPNKRIDSVIKTLENKSKTKAGNKNVGNKNKTKKQKEVKSKDIVDKVLMVVMVGQLLFLLYYFLGY